MKLICQKEKIVVTSQEAKLQFTINKIEMEIEGKIILDLPLQEGISKAGKAWKKKEWVLETFGNYPRKVKFHVFGDRVDQMNLAVGNSYALSFDVESREFNGRWYTDVSVYASRPLDNTQQGGAPVSNNFPPQGGFGEPVSGTMMGEAFDSSSKEDDLPF